MDTQLVADRFSAIPLTDSLIVKPDSLLPARLYIPPVPQLLSVLESKQKSVDVSNMGSSSASGALPAKVVMAAAATPKKKRANSRAALRHRTETPSAKQGLEEFIRGLRPQDMYPMSPALTCHAVNFNDIANPVHRKVTLAVKAAQNRQVQKRRESGSKRRKAKRTATIATPATTKSTVRTGPFHHSPWSTRIRLYQTMNTSYETYRQLIEADEKAVDLDQLFGTRVNPIGPAIVLNNIAPTSGVLPAFICMVTLQFWAHVNRRFISYSPAKFSTAYDEKYPPEVLVLHLGSDFQFSLKSSEDAWYTGRMNLEELALAYSYGDFTYIVMCIFKNRYKHLLNNAAGWKISAWCDNLLQKSKLLTLVSRRFGEIPITNLTEVCNYAIREQFGDDSRNLEVLHNRWYPQLYLYSPKIVVKAALEDEIILPSLFHHHWFGAHRPLLINRQDIAFPFQAKDFKDTVFDPDTYNGDELSVRQWIWEMVFYLSETIRAKVEQHLSNIATQKIISLQNNNQKLEERLAMIDASKDTIKYSSLEETIKNNEAMISKLNVLKRSKLYLPDNDAGYHRLNFARLRYSFVSFNHQLYIAPPWPVLRPTFVTDENQLGYLNAEKVNCMIAVGIPLLVHLQPNGRSRVPHVATVDELIVAVRSLPGSSQHSTRQILSTDRLTTIGQTYRAILVTVEEFDRWDVGDERFVPLDDKIAYLTLHGDVLDVHHERLIVDMLSRTDTPKEKAWDDYRALSCFGCYESDVVRTLAMRMKMEHDPNGYIGALRQSYQRYKTNALSSFAQCMKFHEPSLQAALSQMVSTRDVHKPLPLKEPLTSLLLNHYSISNLLHQFQSRSSEPPTSAIVLDHVPHQAHKTEPVTHLEQVPQRLVSMLLNYAKAHMDTPTRLRPTLVSSTGASDQSGNFIEHMTDHIYTKLVWPIRVQLALLSAPLVVPLPEGKRWDQPDRCVKSGSLQKAAAHVSDWLRKTLRSVNARSELSSIATNSELTDRELWTLQLMSADLKENGTQPELLQHLQQLISTRKQPLPENLTSRPETYQRCRLMLATCLDALETIPASIWDKLVELLVSDVETAPRMLSMIKDLFKDLVNENSVRKVAIYSGITACSQHPLVKAVRPIIDIGAKRTLEAANNNFSTVGSSVMSSVQQQLAGIDHLFIRKPRLE